MEVGINARYLFTNLEKFFCQRKVQCASMMQACVVFNILCYNKIIILADWRYLFSFCIKQDLGLILNSIELIEII